MTERFMAALAVLSLTAPTAAAQIRVDLATQDPGSTITQPVEAGRVQLLVTSRVLALKYNITSRIEVNAIPPFDPMTLSGFRGEAARGPSADCKPLTDAVKALAAAKEERDVPAAVAGIEKLIGVGGCDDAVVTAARTAVDRTTKLLLPVQLRPGERLVTTIERYQPGAGTPDKTWVVILSTQERGRWMTTYGFGFVPNRDERFFTKSAGENKFTITPEEDLDELLVVPSVFFSWLPRSRESRNWALSPTGGIGVTSNAPAVFGGGSMTFNQNLGLVLGLGVYQQRRLAGRYTAGEEISENLTDDQLHRRVFRWGWLIAATYRFGSNPFASDGDDDEPPPAAAPAAAPAPPVAATDAKPPAPAEAFSPTGPTNGFRLTFTERGDLAASSRAALDKALSAAATATDVFVFSHGWWNTPEAAECRYEKMIEGLRKHRPAALDPSFKPVLIGIYWPSALFAGEKGDCGASASGRVTESMVEGSFDSEVRSWATAAFPTARTQTGFDSQLARVVELLGREPRGGTLSAAEADELASILDRWRRAGLPDTTAPAEGPEPETFNAPPGEMVRRWVTTAERVPGRAEASVLSRALSFVNAFTFWTMKERAGIVGSRGVYDVVRKLREGGRKELRIHLIGHSFGGKVVSAAVRGTDRAVPNTVDSLILLQAAFSHFAFTTVDELKGKFGIVSDKPGVYADLVAHAGGIPPVRGVIVATFSKQDQANSRLYPLGVAVRRDFLEAQSVGKYGAIGADGIQGPAVTDLILRTGNRLSDVWRPGVGARIVNVDASDVIEGHSDLERPQVFDLIWDTVLAVNKL